MSLYLSGSVKIRGEEYFCGEISQAAKNLFMWKQYEYPISIQQIANGSEKPPIVKSGRVKRMSQAEDILERVSQETVSKLKNLQKILLEPVEDSTSIKLEESTNVN